MSNEKRKTIGRQLNTQASIAEMTDTGRSQVFTLKTGRKVTFRFVRVPASEVESKTFVNQEKQRKRSTCADQGVPEIHYPDD
ncbi:Uncharacterised protein [Serratia liquefaciens]|nr:Uncharacterised protein [Serratia liquefaciens]